MRKTIKALAIYAYIYIYAWLCRQHASNGANPNILEGALCQCAV